MQAKAIARQVRMSPRKVRLVVDQIRGKSVNEAYAILQFSKKAAAASISATVSLTKVKRAGWVGLIESPFVHHFWVASGSPAQRWQPSGH